MSSWRRAGEIITELLSPFEEWKLDQVAHQQAVCILTALESQRITVVELPAHTDIPSGWEDCAGAWPAITGEDPVSAWPTRRGPSNAYHSDTVALPNGDFITAADARALAAALLAAADVAEEFAAREENK